MSTGNPLQIRIGLSSCGIASGGEPVRAALEDALRASGAPGSVKVVGCNGMCHMEPLVEVVEGSGRRTSYGKVTPDIAKKIVRLHVKGSGWTRGMGRKVRERFPQFMSWSTLGTAPIGVGEGMEFLRAQTRVVLENCGEIDPLSLDDYIARDGYRALEACLKTRTPEQVIAMVREAGLRGRGGAGFPTAQKWAFARGQADPVRHVICNGDEGDPGAFMDRLVLESDPHRVVEGLAIAAYAVGAETAYFYIRAEYPLAVRHIRTAIIRATERGFLGRGILGSDFNLHVELREGAGAFVCGEETALIASIEGRRGTPRPRPPFPAQQGLHRHPTVINNVETLACVPWIVRNGPGRFNAMGTASSAGTKVFALAGKINRGGLIEVPMGITIREIVERIGGGIRDGRTFKAVQIGGPSGGCIPAHLADTPVDYEALRKIGGIMGSGGLVVLDDHDCMVDMARFFLRFTQTESCGKCTFCRIGTKRMLEILEKICDGRGRPDDIAALEELADRVGRTSLCGLGQTAPNPVLTTLRYFRDEYEAHVCDKCCPAGRCTALIRFVINEKCTGCTLCAQACPVSAIAYRPYERHVVEDRTCTRCSMCQVVCPEEAVDVL